MAVEPTGNTQQPADPNAEAQFDAALDESMSKGMVMIGQYVVIPMIKEAMGDADTFSDEE